MAKTQIPLKNWQDYRGREGGIFVYIDTSSKSSWPVRDILNELGKGEQTEPNYETGTWGFISCSNSRLRTAAFNNRRRHVFFGTNYQGTNEEFKGKFFIIGYMRPSKTIDTRKKHTRSWMEQQTESPGCVDTQVCTAFYSEEMNFYSPEDSFPLTEKVMKSWGYKGRVARQMKLTFSDEQCQEILSFFKEKAPQTDSYIQAIEELNADKERLLAELAEKKEDDLW
jgi:hypothetical protein